MSHFLVLAVLASLPFATYGALVNQNNGHNRIMLFDRESKTFKEFDLPQVSKNDTVNVEMLILVDYESYLIHANESEANRYYKAFLKGIDSIYRTLDDPEIHFRLLDIIFFKTEAPPFIKESFADNDKIDTDAFLDNVQKYLIDHKEVLPDYDMVLAFTKHKMCAATQRICVKPENGRANNVMDEPIAVVSDTGAFTTIGVAAHEIGHLLGSPHDGKDESGDCIFQRGYLMNTVNMEKGGYLWSSCTKRNFRKFLNSERAKCLYSAPQEYSALEPTLPGTLLSLEEQCARVNCIYSPSCMNNEICVDLFCLNTSKNKCVSSSPAPDGSSCGDKLHCSVGKCIPVE